jgi:hypothetical protein
VTISKKRSCIGFEAPVEVVKMFLKTGTFTRLNFVNAALNYNQWWLMA